MKTLDYQRNPALTVIVRRQVIADSGFQLY
jgi:hypothetical protein